jgi:hypothetical protein
MTTSSDNEVLLVIRNGSLEEGRRRVRGKNSADFIGG